ncbi:nicotinamide/nicotinate riboside kinase [Entomortierella parvispora]|uniref:Nicotinamide/nicotinate riboside kinase n=1 Tax=Entomortierella parvispora TaxID=205924 RepID=A0A9P3HJ63_9FUNG|nr:nicotinamide/nicotinate riboside kinase [Entomortierella parvispora]
MPTLVQPIHNGVTNPLLTPSSTGIDTSQTITRVVTIGLSGPSSGGKTTVARYLKAILPNSTIVHQDDFYLPEVQIPIDPKNGLANWDCPAAIDFSAMNATLSHVRKHGVFPEGFDSLEDKNPVGSKALSSPIPQNILDELREKILAPLPEEERMTTMFVILDGFILYVDEQLRNAIDFKFFLTAPYQILKDRRESRKGYATLEGYWVDPPGYFDDIVWPNYLICNAPFVGITEAMEAGQDSGVFDSEKRLPGAHPMTQQVDLISSGNATIRMMVESVSSLLARRLADAL